jgi:hypothetical protein
MFRRRGRHSRGAHDARSTQSELGDVTTLSSVAVGAPATRQPPDPAGPEAPPATVPEATLVAVLGGALSPAVPVLPEAALP